MIFWRRRLSLAMPESDAALGEIVGGQLHGDSVAGQDANAVAAETPRQVREHHSVVIELHAEQAAGKFFKNYPGYFNIIFLTHSTFLS
jgi:hypothetical protein